MSKMRKVLLTLVTIAIATTTMAQKYVGGDISLLPSYEANGAKFLDKDGKSITGGMISYFKAQGWNAMRVRLFVDPSKASATHKGEGVRQDLDWANRSKMPA